MPPLIAEPENVELAYKDKKEAYLYRKGLAARYGVETQLVSGIHYNFSFPQKLLDILNRESGELYFHVIRNLYRSAWIMILLFGASPRRFDGVSLNKNEERRCIPYLHSLRAGPTGYSSQNRELPELHYAGLDEYRIFINKAISTPSRRFQTLETGLEQMNTNIAQKESEVYLPFRYRSSKDGPYLEIRIFDIDPFLHGESMKLVSG